MNAPLEQLAADARRLIGAVHSEPALHRAGLLLGLTGQEQRFWPFPAELDAVEKIAPYLAEHAPSAAELDVSSAALVLPVALDQDATVTLLAPAEMAAGYALLVFVLSPNRHVNTVVAIAEPGEDGVPVLAGWRDRSGYIPAYVASVLGVFADVAPFRPQDPIEWGLVEAATHETADLELVLDSAACELAIRRGGEPSRAVDGARLAAPVGEQWQEICALAEELAGRFGGYRSEIALEFLPSQLAALREDELVPLLYACTVELGRRQGIAVAEVCAVACARLPAGKCWAQLRAHLASLPRIG